MPKVEVFQSSRGYRGQDIWIWTQLMALWANLITNRRCLNSWVLLLLIKVQVLCVPSRPYHPAAFPLQPPAPTHSCFLPPSHEGRCWVAQRCLSLATGPLNVLVSEVFWATSVYLSNPCCQSPRKVFFDLFGGQWVPLFHLMTVSKETVLGIGQSFYLRLSPLYFKFLSHFCLPLYVPRAWCEYGLENYVSVRWMSEGVK